MLYYLATTAAKNTLLAKLQRVVRDAIGKPPQIADVDYRIKFSSARGNTKLRKTQKALGKRLYTFAMLSGHTCPFARDCRSSANLVSGHWRIVDGRAILFRCFSASQEVLFNAVRKQRAHNTRIVEIAARSVDVAKRVILASMPNDCEAIRIHIGGDFATLNYFDAWIEVARARPHVLFYAYTKALPFWANRLQSIPRNFVLTASRGGAADELIAKHNLRESVVVESEAHAAALGLDVDVDDTHAAKRGKSFALVVHGSPPAGSAWSYVVKRNNDKTRDANRAKREALERAKRLDTNRKARLARAHEGKPTNRISKLAKLWARSK